jgi:response regulator RpfG family c-di-GMP phosphodiesterase
MWTPTWVGERLRAEGLISTAQLNATLQAMQVYNERMEEALLRIDAIDEERLLRFIAERCRTQYVSTAKLSRLQVTEQTLRYLPERTAEKLLAFPVRYEPETDTISVVSPDAGDPEYTKQLAIGIRARQIRAYLARPAAVKAAIAKWYRGEIQAFAAIAPDANFQFGTSLESSGRTAPIPTQVTPVRRTEPGVGARVEAAASRATPFHPPRAEYFRTPAPLAQAAPAPLALDAVPPPPEPWRDGPAVPPPPEPWRDSPAMPPQVAAMPPQVAAMPPQVAAMPPQVAAMPPQVAAMPPQVAPPQRELQTPLPRMAQVSAPVRQPAPPPPALEPAVIPQPHRGPIQLASRPPPSLRDSDRRLEDLAELLNVLVTLNENTRDEFRGHSASVARLSKMLVERMGMNEDDQLHVTIAANLHDLGKPISYHLTALNVAQYDTHRAAAMKLVYTPQRLVESVNFPIEATTAVGAMYERFDGNGFPGRIAGKQIPLGARVLALCDVYSDLTLNPRNLFRKELTHDEAQAVLGQYAGKLFDPDLVELLSQLVVGEDLRRKLSDDKPLVLIVEPDPEEATILELRLVAQGFDVKVTRAADQALKVAEASNVRFVLSEVELTPFDGFELLQRLRKKEATRDTPFLFVAKSSDASAVDRAFSLGAQDYVVKPTTGDVLAGKLRRLQAAPRRMSADHIAAGVAGQLKDLALPDLIQILFHGRKSGKVAVKSAGREGQLHFQDGRLVHATIDEFAGEEAVYEMLAFSEGTFALDPAFQPSTTTIQTSPEMVILEGLRRLDEKNRGG